MHHTTGTQGEGEGGASWPRPRRAPLPPSPHVAGALLEPQVAPKVRKRKKEVANDEDNAREESRVGAPGQRGRSVAQADSRIVGPEPRQHQGAMAALGAACCGTGCLCHPDGALYALEHPVNKTAEKGGAAPPARP
jgi:hypothetical protein